MYRKSDKPSFDLVKDREMVAKIKHAAQETGVMLNDTENARIFDGGDVKNYEVDLEVVAELGIKHILTNIWSHHRSFYTDQYGCLCDLAKQFDISVNLEFVTWAGVRDLKDAADLLRAVNCDNMGIVVDTLHFYRSRVDFSELDKLPQQWFRYTHLCDCPAEIPSNTDELIRTGLEERLFPGEGCFDFKLLMSKIPNAVRGIEVPNKLRLADMGYAKYATAALRATKNYFGEF